jgi:RNA polymerase sigma-70 factor (ECF subfamily)
MSELPTTRQSLLLRVRNPADADAWSQFVSIYLPLMHRYCMKRGLQDADASDVAQDVLRSISRAIGKFAYDRSKGNFRNWLFTITRNRLRDHLKRQQRPGQGSGQTTVQDLLAEHPEPQENVDWDRDCRLRIFEWAAEQAREQFQESTWRAFRMTAVEGRPAEEAARATGLSVGAVYIAKSRVLARLRELVATVDEDKFDLGDSIAGVKGS